MKTKFKKILKFFTINILIIAISFIILDYLSFLFMENSRFRSSIYSWNRKNYKESENSRYFSYREPIKADSQKNAIVTFGCSYAYGSGVENNETLAGALSKYTHRPAYNYGIPGQSIQHAILDVRSKKTNKAIKESDYAIYIMIGDHLLRTLGIMPYDSISAYPTMDKAKNNDTYKLILHQSKIPFVEYSNLVYYIKKSLILRMLKSDDDYLNQHAYNIVKDHFLELQRDLKKKNPNIKLIVLKWIDTDAYTSFVYSDIWKDLEDAGIIVIDAKENMPEIFDNKNNEIPYCYIADKYCVNGTNSGDDGHPNAKAWDITADLIVNKLNIIK